MFDEPSSYLDVKQRLKAAATIRNILTGEEGGERHRGRGGVGERERKGK